MIVINAAGNEGDAEWKHISAPADVPEVLSVGGVDGNGEHVAFSSTGPSADKRIKPDVCAAGEGVWVVSDAGTLYRGNGTSYSTPLISGVVACLLEARPSATVAEITDALRQSSSQYFDADNLLGHGIPDAVLALKLLGAHPEHRFRRTNLLDVRHLSDGKLHASVYFNDNKKCRLVVATLNGKTVSTFKVSAKNTGVSRIRLPETLAAGTYAAYLYASDGVSSITFDIR
jgi:hypothetical protein